ADLAKHWINRRVIGSCRPTVKDAARAELLFELRVLGIVGILRLLFGVEVVKIAEEFVEAMDSRQKLVAIAEVILAELAADITLWLEELSDGRILRLDSQCRSWQANFGHASADWRLAGNERRATGGAALLAVPVREKCPFLRDAINVGRLITPDAMVITAWVEPADVIAPDDKDVWFVCRQRAHRE